MDPEKNVEQEVVTEQPETVSGQPEQQKEVRKPPIPVKATFWVTIGLLVVLVGLMVAMVVTYSQTLAGVFVLLMFVFAILNRACWKCPACGKHLGRFGHPKNCPHCGEDLKM